MSIAPSFKHPFSQAILLTIGSPGAHADVTMRAYKRDHPRIKKPLEVEIIVSGNKTLFATTYDFSKQGIQILCDAITVRDIFGGSNQSLQPKLPMVIMKLKLDHSNRQAEHIEAECKAIFSRRVSEREYRIGFAIHSLSEPSRKMFERFVTECFEHN